MKTYWLSYYFCEREDVASFKYFIYVYVSSCASFCAPPRCRCSLRQEVLEPLELMLQAVLS